MKAKEIQSRFVICVRNAGCEDLILRKVYQVLPDAEVARDHYLRVIDESDEDYLYPADYFIPTDLPQAAERALLTVTSSSGG